MEGRMFSIIVPVYNVEKYLPKCIESLLNQKMEDYEILLVDDGSTDASGKLCDTYAAKMGKIKTFHKKNGGLSDARNYGVERSSGKYIIFIDSDDFVSDNMLQSFKQVIDRKQNVDLITSNGKYLVYKDIVINDTAVCDMKLSNLSGTEALVKILKLYDDDWNACGKCFKTEMWKKNHFSFKKGRLSEDVELIYKVYIKAERVAVVAPFYYYRQARAGSIISDHNIKLIEDTILNLKEWDIYLRKAMISEELKSLLYERFALQYCTSVLSAISGFPKFEKKRLQKMAKEIEVYLYLSNRKSIKVIRTFYHFCGQGITMYFLYVVRMLKKQATRLKWNRIVKKSGTR